MVLDSLKKRISSAKTKLSGKLKDSAILKKIPRSKKKTKKVDKKLVEDIIKDFSAGEEVELNPRFAFLGIGNDLKGDDGVGWYVIDKLKNEFEKDKNILFVKTSVPENHVRPISEFAPRMLIIIDAADFRKSPGTIKTIKSENIKESYISTHTTPLTLFLRLYQADEAFRKPVMIVGIQKKSNEFGEPISSPVKKAGDRLAKTISALYRKNILDLRLEKELEYLAKPTKRLADYFRSE
jgi:hydrogenase 3 maturation protease